MRNAEAQGTSHTICVEAWSAAGGAPQQLPARVLSSSEDVIRARLQAYFKEVGAFRVHPSGPASVDVDRESAQAAFAEGDEFAFDASGLTLQVRTMTPVPRARQHKPAPTSQPQQQPPKAKSQVVPRKISQDRFVKVCSSALPPAPALALCYGPVRNNEPCYAFI